MVRIGFLFTCICLVTGLFVSCASGPTEKENQEITEEINEERALALLAPRHDQCRRDCIQPPLLRSLLIARLVLDQERILAREDYLKNMPPKVTDVAYGPAPDGPLRGDKVLNGDGKAYDGPLNWHTVPFEKAITENSEDRTFRNRQVSGSHCYFARKPNRHSPLFTVLVLHHPDRGDVLYVGGPDMPTTRVDTVPLTDHHSSPIRVRTDHIRCTFRDDQPLVGAIIVHFEYADVEAPSNGPHYAVFEVALSDALRPTGRTKIIERAAGRGAEPITEEVEEMQLPAPVVEFRGSFTDAHDALKEIESFVPSGRFRLRREFTYPRMPYLSYLGGEEEEFCPVNTKCETPPAQLDVDARPMLEPEEIEKLEQAGLESEEGLESDAVDESDESDEVDEHEEVDERDESDERDRVAEEGTE